MEIKIDMDQLRERSLFLAVPMYGGNCCGHFCRSVMELAQLCTQMGIKFYPHFIFNESLITRARNYCADAFMRSEFTHLLFIDSDIGFNPQDVIAMLALASDDSEYDVLTGPYPKKCISWEKIKLAVDKGFADNDPNVLERFVGDFVFNPKNGQSTIQLNEPVEVAEAGTGFMLIRRSTFERYQVAFPELMYKPDHVRTADFDGSREIMAFFDCVIDPESRRYLSEDYFFCYNVWKMGGKVWLCPWMRLAHMGSYVFGGSLVDLAQVGAAATASPAELEKTKKRTK